MTDEKLNTILIIDDETLIRESYADYLEDHDYNILMAENGRIGLEIMKNEMPDLILTDLRMPEVSGLEVLQRAQEISPETPLIVISGTGRIADSVQALKLGAWDYILKPVEDMSIITHAIEQSLEKARLRRENKAYQENLEAMVTERTGELKQANERLRRINERLQNVAITTRELTACSDMDHFGSTLLSEFAAHMAASGGSLFLVEKKGYGCYTLLIPSIYHPLSLFRSLKNPFSIMLLMMENHFLIQDIQSERKLSASGWEGYPDNSALVFPIPDESGRIAGVLSLHSKTQPPFVDQDREIGTILASHGSETLRAVQSTHAMRETEARQRIILNSLRIGVLVIDPETGTIVESNSEAAKLIGIEYKKLIGMENRFFSSHSDEEAYPAEARNRMVDNVEGMLLKANGSSLPVLKTVVPIQLNGKPHLLGSFIDISKRKEVQHEKELLELQLSRAQKLEAVGTLAGGLAHDLNNALNGIFGPASILLNRLRSGRQLPEDQLDKQLSRMQQSGYRISDMVSQLMAVSYKQELSLAVVDLNLSVKHVLKIVQNTFDKSIEIRPRFFKDSARTSADPTQIEQVLLNLAINAAHAMTIMRNPNETWGGKLQIVVDYLHADESFKQVWPDATNENYWRITVVDTGVGMDQKKLTRIFTPFFTTKEKEFGTGLGLAMVYSIVKQHHGFIDVNSTPGVGSTFDIYLPELPYDKSREITPDKLEQISVGEGLVLVVDDEEISRDMASEILAECGYRTITAENGLQALEIYENRHQEIDLVLLDLVMPKMSGKETYAALQAVNPDAKVLLVSGFREDKRVKAVLAMGSIGFMQKPYEIIKFSRIIKECIS